MAYICLRSVRQQQIPSLGLPYVHEAAHALHATMDAELSPLWSKQFPIRRAPGVAWNDPTVRDANELVVAYAAFDYGRDGWQRIRIPEGYPQFVTNIGEMLLEYFGSITYTAAHLMVRHVAQELHHLTPALAAAPRHLKIFPGCNSPGYFLPERTLSDTYWSIAEDVACSTEWFTVAARTPYHVPRLVRKIHLQRKTRERLEVLAERGFIGEEAADFLCSQTLFRDVQDPKVCVEMAARSVRRG